MHIEHTVAIAAPAHVVWNVMTDVQRWPTWTPSIEQVAMADGDAFGPGAEALVKPRGGGRSWWRVTEWEPGRAFAWATRQGGMRIVANHVFTQAADGVEVTLSVDVTGPLLILLRRFLEGPARRNVADEAAGLKRECERVAALESPEGIVGV